MLKFSRGFTLIELLIGLVIVAVLTTMAVPSFSSWIGNMKIRTAAEAVLAGLQLARAEALKRNTPMAFQLTSTLDASCALNVAGPNWIVSGSSAVGKCDKAPSESDAPQIVQKYDGTQAGGSMTKIVSGQALFTFNGLGRLTSTAANIQVTGPGGTEGCGKARCMRIEVSSGGGVRMCDPALPGTNSQGC